MIKRCSIVILVGVLLAPSAGAQVLPSEILKRGQLAVDRVNQYRALSGLPAVVLDEVLSDGALLHAAYLSNNVDQIAAGLDAHEEYPDRLGYSEAGRDAGKNSDIYYGRGGVEPVDGWYQTYYHRNPILSPGVTRVGYGDWPGPGYQIVVMRFDVYTGPGDVLSPGPGAAGQATSAHDEVPAPIEGFGPNRGNPIIAYFAGDMAEWTRSRVIADGVELPHRVIAPNLPSQASFEVNEICLITESPLPTDAIIEVELDYRQAGEARKVEWRFRTGAMGVFDPVAAKTKLPEPEAPGDRQVIDAQDPGGCTCTSAPTDRTWLVLIGAAAIVVRAQMKRKRAAQKPMRRGAADSSGQAS